MNDARAAVIAAADRIDPALGAFITVDVEAALRAAADRPRTGRLAGTVIAVKDLVDVAGLPTTNGTARYDGRPATATAPSVRALLDQGAVVLGKTNLNEFAFGVSGYNPHHGPILVPRDTTRTAGGSSGGSAAAVAAGVCDIAVGTDTSGSVRIPAACCGVWGFKCAGGGDLTGVHPLAPAFDSLGFLASGPGPLRRVLGITAEPDPAGIRCGEAGVDLEVPALPPGHWTIFRHQARRLHRHRLAADPGALGAGLRLKLGLEPGDLPSALRAENEWRARYAAAVAGYDVIVQPVLDGAAPRLADAIDDYEHGRTSVNDRLLRHTPAANALGWPALAFPTADGPRQVLGRPGTEAMLLAVAEQLNRRD